MAQESFMLADTTDWADLRDEPDSSPVPGSQMTRRTLRQVT
jgi:hypothetical protein